MSKKVKARIAGESRNNCGELESGRVSRRVHPSSEARSVVDIEPLVRFILITA